MINTKKNGNKKPKFLVVIRHGERIDFSAEQNDQKLDPNDPELTEEGKAQAQKIGQIINTYFIKKTPNEFKSCLILTSPFSRTIMTSVNIANRLKDSKINVKIMLENRLSEFIKDDAFDKECSKFLSVYNYKENEDLKQFMFKFIGEEYLNELNTESLEGLPQFNETRQNVYNRLKVLFKNNISNFEEFDYIFCVSHGTPIAEFYRFLRNDKEDIRDSSIKYCDAYVFEYFKTLTKSEVEYVEKLTVNSKF